MTAPFDPPLTLAMVQERVKQLREADREARIAIEKVEPVTSRQRRHMTNSVDYLARVDTLRANVIYMIAWHKIDGDVVEIARELGKLVERSSEGP